LTQQATIHELALDISSKALSIASNYTFSIITPNLLQIIKQEIEEYVLNTLCKYSFAKGLDTNINIIADPSDSSRLQIILPKWISDEINTVS
jgi:hypothetical protein